MPAKRYRVKLTEQERSDLIKIVDEGKGSASYRKRAQMLLMTDESQPDGGSKDAEIAKAVRSHRRTVERVRQCCVEQGLEAALNHKRPKRPSQKLLDGAAEARLVQLACTEAPDGREKWSMQLLADKLIELEIVETISDETVRTTLKKMS